MLLSFSTITFVSTGNGREVLSWIHRKTWRGILKSQVYLRRAITILFMWIMQ